MNSNEMLENDPLDVDFWNSAIEAAPQDPAPLTEKEKNAEMAALELECRREKQRRAVGPRTGWPGKYLEAIQSPPRGDEWLEAFEAAKRTVKNRGILVLYGKRGAGKTRMGAELAGIVGRSQYRTAMRFFLEVRATFCKTAEKTEVEVIDELTTADLLILDEIQERGSTPFEDRLLTHVIDARYARQLPTILIANLTKKELAASLGDSIVDRTRENGKSIEFNWPSYRVQL